MEVPSGFEPENKGFAEQLLRKEQFIFYTRFDKYMDSGVPRKSFTPLLLLNSAPAILIKNYRGCKFPQMTIFEKK